MWGAGSYVKRNYETTVDGIKEHEDYLWAKSLLCIYLYNIRNKFTKTLSITLT